MPRVNGMTTLPRGWECVACVVEAVESWAGVPVLDLNTTLANLFMVNHGACDRGALRSLKALLDQKPCGRRVPLGRFSCAWTVSRLVREVCGF